MKHGYKVAIDMDGVLSDWEGMVRKLMGRSAHEELEKKKIWRAISAFDAHTPFYYSLEKHAGADELIDFVTKNFPREDIFILTAAGYTPSDAAHQKRRWIRRYIGDFRTEVVTKSEEKALFAKPEIILIDDRAKCIDPFVEAGGMGILHTDVETTIEVLQKILDDKRTAMLEAAKEKAE